MRLLTVVGARPQFVKAATVSRAIAAHNSAGGVPPIAETIVHTGQHYDHNMSQRFFEEMDIPQPRYNLGVGSGPHGETTGRMLAGIEEVLQAEQPDVVLVYGDTNSTLAAALAAAKLHLPVAHVEAGLRSYNMRMPEEVNRLLTDRLSRWLFCPTVTAVKNLEREGMPAAVAVGRELQAQEVLQVGDVMYDAVLHYRDRARPSPEIGELLGRYPEGFFLATVHRAENTDSIANIGGIVKALETLSRLLPVVLPLHPRTRRALAAAGIHTDELVTIDPVGYFDMLVLLGKCRVVLTDSGGVQKEAYFFEKPCVTLREETEWVELVEGGFNVLVGADPDRIVVGAESMLCTRPSFGPQLYGDGNAATRVVQAIA
ncbi:MAG: UDP-N-acetylglucosamine 2-epimerase (non-hydrolyzing), partial [Syntrophomonadaceae bacterium]|nr:UDP-N-acetylglucosamine 2-epimerase (non-hydrolyzing) [Syntrophomonadaceae bacterium]